MPRDREPDAEHAALGHVADAATELLEQLRTTSDAGERATLGAVFAARIDGLRADLRRRHGLTDRDATAVLARALAHVEELGQAVSGRT